MEGIKFVCDICGKLIETGRPRFVFKGELFCAYDGASFDESTPKPKDADLQQEIQRLIAICEARSEKELTDEIYYTFSIDLCASCRRKVYEMLDRAHGHQED